MLYFTDCTTLDALKTAYKKLALQHHPDRGGDTAVMQAINKEYAFAAARLAQGQGLSDEETSEQIHLSEQYRQVIEQLVLLPEIQIELVGLWIWVTGNTYPVKTQLKNSGLFFAPKKQAWYYRSEKFKTRNSKKTLDQIRSKYGSSIIPKKGTGGITDK